METDKSGSDCINDMNILERVRDFYDQCELDMFKDISTYMTHGYVHKTPESFILAKPVRTDLDEHPSQQWGVVGADAWYVHCAVGDDWIMDWIDLMPYPLPKVGWMRQLKDKPVKFWDLESILRRRR